MSDVLDERFLKAEGQLKRDQYRPKDNRKWLKAKCSFCSYVFQYSPQDDFTGDLRCPSCGKTFHISRLSDFIGGERIE